MIAPTGTTIAPKPGKDTTRSSAGGKATAKTNPKGLPKVSNNYLGGRPNRAKTTIPSSIVTCRESDGGPSGEREGKADESSAKNYEHEGGMPKKSPSKRRARKQVVKGKKEKKRKLLQAQKGEEDRLINSFVSRNGDDKFIADCALTDRLKGKEKKSMSKRGGGVSASDSSGDEDDSVEASPTVGDLETTSPSTDDC